MDDQEKFSIVLFSGTVDKLVAAVTLATGAAVMGKEVNIFLTYWGVVAFRKGRLENQPPLQQRIRGLRRPDLRSDGSQRRATRGWKRCRVQWNWVTSQ